MSVKLQLRSRIALILEVYKQLVGHALIGIQQEGKSRMTEINTDADYMSVLMRLAASGKKLLNVCKHSSPEKLEPKPKLVLRPCQQQDIDDMVKAYRVVVKPNITPAVAEWENEGGKQ